MSWLVTWIGACFPLATKYPNLRETAYYTCIKCTFANSPRDILPEGKMLPSLSATTENSPIEGVEVDSWNARLFWPEAAVSILSARLCSAPLEMSPSSCDSTTFPLHPAARSFPSHAKDKALLCRTHFSCCTCVPAHSWRSSAPLRGGGGGGHFRVLTSTPLTVSWLCPVLCCPLVLWSVQWGSLACSPLCCAVCLKRRNSNYGDRKCILLLLSCQEDEEERACVKLSSTYSSTRGLMEAHLNMPERWIYYLLTLQHHSDDPCIRPYLSRYEYLHTSGA